MLRFNKYFLCTVIIQIIFKAVREIILIPKRYNPLIT